MALANQFRNDVFISYAHADNEESFAGHAWVSQLVRFLDISLKQRLGCGDELKVYFDRRDLRSSGELEELKREASDSALFIAISSPSYVSRDWTIRELEAFLANPDALSRLFVVEMLPLDNPNDHPASIIDKPRVKFWQCQGSESRAAVTLEPTLDRQLYGQRLLGLVDEMKLRLSEMQAEHRRADTQANEAPHDLQMHGGTVLLAQATDELELEREQVISHLQQAGVTLLPEHDYPQGGTEFVSAFQHDLERADLVVQLLGRAVGRRPPDLPEGYTKTQFEQAVSSGKPMMLWHHPAIVAEDTTSALLQDAFSSESLIVSGLEGFKADILRRLKAIRAPKSPTTPASLVYVGADRSDLEVARQLQATLMAHDIPVVIPTFEGTSEEIRQDLEESIAESDALLFVHGEASTNWVRGNLRRLHKLIAQREKQPKVIALIKTPPREKGELGMALPYVQLVDCSEVLDFESLVSLVSNES